MVLKIKRLEQEIVLVSIMEVLWALQLSLSFIKCFCKSGVGVENYYKNKLRSERTRYNVSQVNIHEQCKYEWNH